MILVKATAMTFVVMIVVVAVKEVVVKQEM